MVRSTFVKDKNSEDLGLSERFNRVLEETVEAMEESRVRYVFIGGIASGGLGRPRSTRDIDIFVMPEEADCALRALSKRGFKVEKTDPSWLYKGFKDNILVDVIFKSKGEIYLDSEMYQKNITAEFHGKKLRLVAPEDLLIIKAAAHSELTPGHWHDAIALLSYANINWKYLIKRARRAPRRVLSLLLYAQSSDIWVPNYVIHELYSGIFETGATQTPQAKTESIPSQIKFNHQAYSKKQVTSQAYAIAHLKERLAEDPRVNELDIQVDQLDNQILLRGEVQLEDRRQAVEQITREIFPEHHIENQLRVLNFQTPAETEEIK